MTAMILSAGLSLAAWFGPPRPPPLHTLPVGPPRIVVPVPKRMPSVPNPN